MHAQTVCRHNISVLSSSEKFVLNQVQLIDGGWIGGLRPRPEHGITTCGAV